ncbi:hypothetical protein [Methylobacterium soli]|uniref:Uncharacterized protein n=1 Tax=Methylobacterium soli TaxID=553447 RepID=A0A6L3TAF4_9HYPH|nr:hypothetical protein [Methylobacterium soli]KAB1080877.1 hypothetical protein F6X53_04085 [Methylobacterium soli]GJE45287.1 hypothetical protein AEGHOMDF_4481 [Methylobacterium soli]
MEIEALERPADLAIWSLGRVNSLLVQPERFNSLREAIIAAAGVLSDHSKQPWIITEEGDLLPPNWIRAYLT